MSQTFIYPFDPTGITTANAVSSEQHVLSPPAWSDFHFIVPKFAPYFQTSLRVVHRPSGRTMVEGVDYHCTHWFHDASYAVGRQLFGSITFLDKLLVGVSEIHYQTIGGEWCIDTDKALEILSNTALNPRITTWESVVDLPFQFPVIDHEWNLADLKGTEDVVLAINKITQAVRDADAANGAGHASNLDNPHSTTKAQVGLGDVQNYGIASVSEATAGLLNTKYMTPLRTVTLINAMFLPLIQSHINNLNNPHQVNKGSIDLGLVENYAVASTLEAEVGASNSRYMTPLTTAAAINKRISDTVTAHFTNLNNPHATNKAQVGLGLVENFAVAQVADVNSGTSNGVYMTPLRTSQMIALQLSGPIDEHIYDYTNPHRTTKVHVGLGSVQNFPVATNAQAIGGIDIASYMTPLLVKSAIVAFAITEIDSHRLNTNNPHQTTKAHVNLGQVENYPIATLQDATDGNRNDVYMTPLRTKAMMAAQVGGPVGDHINNYSNPHQTTAAQVGAYTKDEIDATLLQFLPTNGTAADSSLLGGLSVTALTNNIRAGQSADSLLFNGKTQLQLTNDILSQTSSNADKLSNLTLTEIMDNVESLVDTNKRAMSVTLDSVGDFAGDVIWSCIGKVDILADKGVVSLYLEDGDFYDQIPTSRILKIYPNGTRSSLYYIDGDSHYGNYYYKIVDTVLEIWIKTVGQRNHLTVNVMAGKDAFTPFPPELSNVLVDPTGLIEITARPDVTMESILTQLDAAFIGADALFV